MENVILYGAGTAGANGVYDRLSDTQYQHPVSGFVLEEVSGIWYCRDESNLVRYACRSLDFPVGWYIPLNGIGQVPPPLGYFGDELGVAYGSYCYGEGCLDEPPPAQAPDPFPLPDLEAGYTPPHTFRSTQVMSATCDAGFVNITPASAIPEMTDDDAPSGLAVASSDNGGDAAAWLAFDNDVDSAWESSAGAALPQWIEYRFPASKNNISSYTIQVRDPLYAPRSWILEGSNDGLTWTLMDKRVDMTWAADARTRFWVTTPGTYTRYRLTVLTIDNQGEDPDVYNRVIIGQLGLHETPAPASATGTASSTTSQDHADSLARDAALTAARAKLNCVAIFESSQPYRASCPAGSKGADVTRTATRRSFIDANDAEKQAYAAAKALAEADLVCGESNNTLRIDIPGAGRATPYPSVKFVSGLSGTVGKVTVTIKKLKHLQFADVALLLKAPDGKAVYLMGNCMNAPNDDEYRTIIFDDDAPDSLPEDSRPAGPGPHTFKPTVYGGQLVPFPGPAPLPDPGPEYAVLLSAFNGIDPNGAWSLWVFDDSNLDAGFINDGWDLTITTTP